MKGIKCFGFESWHNNYNYNDRYEQVLNQFFSNPIARIELDNDANDESGELRLFGEDGKGVAIRDEGQQCCERRFLTCSDDLQTFVGANLLQVELKNFSYTPRGDEGEDMGFVEMLTDKGAITLETHNEHNGYYGGFDMCIREIGEDTNEHT
jgi:hypothetical protein